MQVQSLGWEDPLDEGVAIHSSDLAWRIPWTEEPGGLQSMGLQRVDMTEATEHTHTLHVSGIHLGESYFSLGFPKFERLPVN